MKELYAEGLATHGDPKPCAGIHKGAGEASAGAHAGRVLSREIIVVRSADVVPPSGRQHGQERQSEFLADSARSKTPRMRGTSMRENRESRWSPEVRTSSRNGKGTSPKPKMNDHRKSDSSIVPTKSPNKARTPAAEVAEGKGLAKGNAGQQNAHRTQSRARAPNALDCVRQAARRDRKTPWPDARFDVKTQGKSRVR